VLLRWCSDGWHLSADKRRNAAPSGSFIHPSDSDFWGKWLPTKGKGRMMNRIKISVGRALMAASSLAAVGGAVAPSVAQAHDHWRGYYDDDWHDHGWHRGWRGRSDVVVVEHYYAPPPPRVVEVYREPRYAYRERRYYCRRGDGTTGAIVGGALGALVGRGLDGRGDRAVGTILGAGGGALLGREVARNSC
jgi:hypothetical protein